MAGSGSRCWPKKPPRGGRGEFFGREVCSHCLHCLLCSPGWLVGWLSDCLLVGVWAAMCSFCLRSMSPCLESNRFLGFSFVGILNLRKPRLTASLDPSSQQCVYFLCLYACLCVRACVRVGGWERVLVCECVLVCV